MTYTLVVALAGIAIVFVFLTVLSLIMALIPRLVDPRRANDEQTRSGAAKREISTEPSTGSVNGRSPDWVYAAAIAYLDNEEHGSAYSYVWVRTRTAQHDPWVAGRLGGRCFERR